LGVYPGHTAAYAAYTGTVFYINASSSLQTFQALLRVAASGKRTQSELQLPLGVIS
jgi:hypothetical protein